MWISKKEYNKLLNKIQYLEKLLDEREQIHRMDTEITKVKYQAYEDEIQKYKNMVK